MRSWSLVTTHDPERTEGDATHIVARRAVCSAIVVIAVAVVQACGLSPQTPSTAIPRALLNQARPIGTGPLFQPPATGPVIGRCARPLGRRSGVHVEVFAANRVVLLPAGIGTRPPRSLLFGQIARASCYGAMVTLGPTGLVLIRPGARCTLGQLFRSWGQPLSLNRLASFRAPEGTHVTVFVDGREWRGMPAVVPLTPHGEIVLEVGPHVPPHSSYMFPHGT